MYTILNSYICTLILSALDCATAAKPMITSGKWKISNFHKTGHITREQYLHKNGVGFSVSLAPPCGQHRAVQTIWRHPWGHGAGQVRQRLFSHCVVCVTLQTTNTAHFFSTHNRSLFLVQLAFWTSILNALNNDLSRLKLKLTVISRSLLFTRVVLYSSTCSQITQSVENASSVIDNGPVSAHELTMLWSKYMLATKDDCWC